jgi:HNH endonuclease
MNPKKRFEIFHRDNFTCFYCGRKPPEVALEVDHRIPKSAGGEDVDENLVTACRDCNIGKSDSILDDEIVFIHKQDGMIDHERSLKRNGLWKYFSAEERAYFSGKIQCETPHSVQAADFRARSHAWMIKKLTEKSPACPTTS